MEKTLGNNLDGDLATKNRWALEKEIGRLRSAIRKFKDERTDENLVKLIELLPEGFKIG